MIDSSILSGSTMKQTVTRLQRMLLLNLLLLLGYIAYNEYFIKFFPQEFKAVCKLIGADEEQGLFAVSCLKK